MSLQIDLSGLASLALLLNSLALLIALGGAWLLLATRWRQQRLATDALSLAEARMPAIEEAGALATQRIDRFFYCFGFGSLGLAWLLSSLTRLAWVASRGRLQTQPCFLPVLSGHPPSVLLDQVGLLDAWASGQALAPFGLGTGDFFRAEQFGNGRHR